MVNKVILIGNLGQDPEVKETKTGNHVCKLRLATTDRRKDRDSGDWSDNIRFLKGGNEQQQPRRQQGRQEHRGQQDEMDLLY